MSIETIVSTIMGHEKTARDYVEAALAKAESTKDYHALLSVTRERALERADMIDAKIAAGEDVGVLAGVPFVVKDNFLAFGAPTTAASKILENFDAPLQATAVEKLERAGAICIGKANLDAFAHGGSTENSAFGPTKNAVDPTRVAGGSSGGSAVVTALDVVPFSIGTDTGGSVRQPASFNGVVGFKPTYGMVSRYGVIAMANSTDTIGCLTQNVRDAEIVMQVMAGRDDRDMTTLPEYFVPEANTLKRQKIGIIKEFMSQGVEPDVRDAVTNYVEKLRAAGHTVEEIELPVVEHTSAVYYIVVPAEVSSNLARYDGIRYGRRAQGAKTLAELYGRSRDEGFVTENKRRIMIGSYVLSSGYFDAYYLQAQKVRTMLIDAYDKLFKDYDFLVGPVSPTPAFKLGENTNDPVKMYLADIMTIPASLAGLPAISVPAGTTKDGLPIGVQIMAARRHDAAIMALAQQMEVHHD